VYEGVGVVIGGVLVGGEAQVPLPEEENLVVVGKECPDADVELALSNQHRTFDVFLDDET
jgi:hypothetical protein